MNLGRDDAITDYSHDVTRAVDMAIGLLQEEEDGKLRCRTSKKIKKHSTSKKNIDPCEMHHFSSRKERNEQKGTRKSS